MLKQEKLKYRHYNICRGETIDLKTLAGIILSVTGKKLNVKIALKGLKKEYSGDNGRIMDEIGHISFTSHPQAISELFAWYKENKRKLDRNLLLTDK